MAPQDAPLPRHNALIPADDAIALLTANHHTVRTLYRQYKGMDEPATKRRIAEDIFAALALHATLEETVLYPAFAAQAGEEGDRMVGGARQEHQVFRDLRAVLRQCDAEEFETSFHALMDLVEQHMAEEETEMFPLAAELLAEHMDELLKAMRKLQQQSVTS